MKHDFITTGGATEDITFYTKEGILLDNQKDLIRQKLLAFEYGAKIKVDQSFSGFGGGAANAAVCFARLGFKASCLAAIGDDLRGQRILDNFKKQGVDISLMQKVKGAETGFSFLLVGSGNEHICFSNRAANNQLKITNHELRILRDAKWIYLTSLSGEWQASLDKIFSVRGSKIAWNPGHRQILGGIKILKKYFKRADCLIVNKDEALEIVISDNKYKSQGAYFLNDTKKLLAALASYGSEIIVITNGRHGADAMARGQIYHQSIVKEQRRVDTTGVGDAFGSSFIAGLELYNQEIKRALLLAAKNSAAEISEQGAQNGLLRKKDI
ncbi:MAG: carbohydrate kinase family protein [Patescibacteria group bacterium]|nr:carbohydrate kinase family protein [Patescibacteria group bacterium]